MNQKLSNQISVWLHDCRILSLLSLLIIIPCGLFSKAYTGIGQKWVQDYSGDILYEIFWFIRPIKDEAILRNVTSKIALGVFIITCVIEVSQLWFYLVPGAISSSLVWRMLLGAGFDQRSEQAPSFYTPMRWVQAVE